MNSLTEEECKFIDLTITRIEDEITALRVKQALLRRRLNASRAHTNVLPPEVLTKIFEDVGGSWQQNRHVGGVCFYWRQVLLASPSFWACVSLSCGRETAQNLLHLHLQNARGTPLSIELILRDECHDETAVTKLLDTLFVDSSCRIKMLDVHTVSLHIWKSLLPYFKMGSSFPKLEELILAFPRTNHDELLQHYESVPQGTLLFPSPRLQRLQLRNPPPGIESHLALQTLTSLTVDGHDLFYHGLRILSHCPNLVTFTWSSRRLHALNHTFVHPNVNTTTTLLYLKYISIVNYEAEWSSRDANIVQHLRLPSMHEMIWRSSLALATRDIWIPFFSSMSALRMLTCHYSEGTLELLHCLPSLEVLEISCRNLALDLLTAFMASLIWEETTGVVPYLKQFTLRVSAIGGIWDRSFPVLDAMIRVLDSRRTIGLHQRSPLEKFSLTTDRYSAITDRWKQVHQESFRRLARGGLELVMMEDGIRQVQFDVE